MTAVAALLGGLRGQEPPAEFYHPAVARRKLRQDMRALQEASLQRSRTQPDGADPAVGQGPAAGSAAP